MRMNHKIRLGLGGVCFILGGIYFINSIFIGESIDWIDAVITRIIYLAISLSFLGGGYYLIFKKKQPKTMKTLS